MEKQGYICLQYQVLLSSPFVTGLGIDHPTETNLLLDRNTGVPYIPASSQKGVMRLAAALNFLRDEEGEWLPENELPKDVKLLQDKKCGGLCLQAPESLKTLFGFQLEKKGKDGCAGHLIVLDSYPVKQPQLAEDILNPHFPEYYQDEGGKRGPTEDQNPIPVKFLVVKHGCEFVFRLLLRPLFSDFRFHDRMGMRRIADRAVRAALQWEGLGAKTSLGYGRFVILDKNKERITKDTDNQKRQVNTTQIDPVAEQQKRVDQFVQHLPKSAELPGQASEILARIKGMKKTELRKECLKQLTSQFKNVINKGVKNKKKWALAIMAFCKEEGLN